MINSAPSSDVVRKSVRRHLIAGLALTVILLAGVGGWAAVTNISGAVIGAGRLVVETNTKRVQHPDGGIVRQIAVRDGDQVSAGDVIIQLDDTLMRANLSIVSRRLDALNAQASRLQAERDGALTVSFPELATGHPRHSEILEVQRSELRLFEARSKSLSGRKAQLAEQIGQLERRIEGLQAQERAKAIEVALISAELEDLELLLSKGLVSQNRVVALQRDRAQLIGEEGRFVAEIAEARQAISERHIQINA